MKRVMNPRKAMAPVVPPMTGLAAITPASASVVIRILVPTELMHPSENWCMTCHKILEKNSF